jgi:MFS family permease
MVFPLLPLYITTVLGGTAVAVGVIEGAAEATASLLKVVSGYWSDKIKKRKPFVFFGYTLSALMKPLLAFAGNWFSVLAVRVADRIGKGLRDAPRDTIVAESNNKATLGKAYGLNRAMDGLGSVGGALLAVLLLPILGFTNLFKLAIIPGILAVLIIFFVQEPVQSKNKNSNNKKISLRFGFSRLTKELKIFILIATIFTLGNYNYSFLMLRAQNQGLSNQAVIMLYALFYLVYMFLSTRAGEISDKKGRQPIILAGYIIFTLLSLGLYFFNGLTYTIISFILFGIFFALIDGSQRALVADLAPEELKGTALGAFHTFTGLAALPAGYIAGQLWVSFSPKATYLFGTGIGLISILLFYSILKNNKKTNKT